MTKHRLFGIRNLFKSQSRVIENMGYLGLLQVFTMLVPLITYPYLIRKLGKDLYGWVIIAQMLSGYFSIFIDFGFRKVSARHISIHRDDKSKLSEIVSSILTFRGMLWIVGLALYLGVVLLVPSYRAFFLLFLFSYGLTFNELLFPQFYYQGIEQMRYITIVNIIIKTVFVLLIFVFIRQPSDYLLVPVFTTIGCLIGGLVSIRIIFVNHGIRFYIPRFSVIKHYTMDSAPVFLTDMLTMVKDKLNYFLIGGVLGAAEVTVYDLGSKIMNLISKFISVISTALFPRMARARNVKLFKKVAVGIFGVSVLLVIFLNLFLPVIVPLLYSEEIDLMPIRLFTLAPLFVELSSFISSNLFIAFGYNKYVLYSIIVTTSAYLLALGIMFLTGRLQGVVAFVLLALIGYLIELLYRLFLASRIFRKEALRQNQV